MGTREAHQLEIESRIKKLSARIDELRDRIAGEGAHAPVADELEKLKRKRRMAKGKLDALHQASEGTWEGLGSGIDGSDVDETSGFTDVALPTTIDPDVHLVRPGERVQLTQRSSKVDGSLDKAAAKAKVRKLQECLRHQQRLLHAGGEHAVLIVLQAMDAAGKDSAVRRCFGPLNPRSCRATSFAAPSEEELAHDFLWRVHRAVPARGDITIFNRSHYEDVLIGRVKGLVPARTWRKRYAHINAFEQLLADEGVIILKFYLHVSKGYQKERLARRLRKPDKHWKFDPDDLEEREYWDDYMAAYEEVFARCSKAHAPWYIVPAERRWYRDLVVVQTLVNALAALDLDWPRPELDLQQFTIK